MPYACGGCVGKGEACGVFGHQCSDNLKCVQIKSGFSPVCLPTVEKNEICDYSKDYDPCESPSYSCERNGSRRCEPNFFAGFNDDCTSDRYCKTGLICQGGKCKQIAPGACLTGDNCGWNEYCASNQIGVGGLCRPRLSSFQSCNYSGVCKYAHSCISSSCIPHFTIEEGGDCTITQDCKPGFECKKDDSSGALKCTKPKYYLLIPPSPTVAWGQECDPYNSFYSSIGGCRCDYGLHIYRFAKEEGRTFREFCKIRHQNLNTCMENNGCSAINIGADTCMRKFCYGQYKDMMIDCATDPSSVVFCSASSISLFVLMIVLFVLLL